jgi:NAD(P)-dependent dehydrogenase (short-subunit alcohol dehydrogenase family)
METVAEADGLMSFMGADMTVADDVRRLIASSEPQILVNNAGGGGHIPPRFPEATAEQWGATLDLNLRGSDARSAARDRAHAAGRRRRRCERGLDRRA